MTKLLLEFPLEEEAVKLKGGRVIVSMGNGVQMVAEVPLWIQYVHAAKLSLELEIQGSPPDAKSITTPVV